MDDTSMREAPWIAVDAQYTWEFILMLEYVHLIRANANHLFIQFAFIWPLCVEIQRKATWKDGEEEDEKTQV